jgi:hypothetical protein
MKTRLATIFGIISASLVVLGNAHGQAFTGTYDFSLVTAGSGGATDPTPPPTATGLTFGSFSSVGYIGNPNAGGRFSWQTNALGGVNGVNDFSSFTGSIDLGRYLSVTITPNAGYSLDLNSISFTIQRSGSGIRSYSVRSSLDSFSANLPASISPANANLAVGAGNQFQWVLDSNTSAQNGSLITLGAGYDALTSAVTFNFYGWNAELVGGTFSIDNVVLSGAVTPVPEPGTIALTGLGLVALALYRRK